MKKVYLPLASCFLGLGTVCIGAEIGAKHADAQVASSILLGAGLGSFVAAVALLAVSWLLAD